MPSMLALLFFMPPPAEGQNPLISFIPLILIFVVFYFFLIRPQKKKEQTRQSMIDAIKKGDRFITVGGVHGTVTQVDDTSVLAQVDSSTKLRIEKNAISSVNNKDD
ncbi:MAG: preprotein translocase subunit YajC [Rhodothermales bacterium]